MLARVPSRVRPPFIDISATCAISSGMPLPQVQPIIPIARKEPFDDPDWLFELKYDGIRALLYLEKGSGSFLSRNGNTLTRFDALARAVAAEIEVTETIFDGEVIAADDTGRPLFYDLLRRTRRPAYVAFDLLWLNGADLTLSASQRAPPAPAGHPAERILRHFRGAFCRG
jgi:ATP-dependent DNA ligase